ncbi:unnamed protein product, partial [Mesorhabditis belari]|uniref:Serine/threonine specific protein phosphatases domain-containing protein n=1 Tax=Mesorhabditis belari TaxID=2138241 RepID=A0AAF3FAA9_9BILA
MRFRRRAEVSVLPRKECFYASTITHRSWATNCCLRGYPWRVSRLLRIFEKTTFPPDANFIFLGGYVDRGQQNIETISLMFCYKIKYPESFLNIAKVPETKCSVTLTYNKILPREVTIVKIIAMQAANEKRFFANRKIVDIFSAPHYCVQFDNSAATMKISFYEVPFPISREKFIENNFNSSDGI